MFGKGISREGDVLDLAAGLDIVNKSGAWYGEGKQDRFAAGECEGLFKRASPGRMMRLKRKYALIMDWTAVQDRGRKLRITTAKRPKAKKC